MVNHELIKKITIYSFSNQVNSTNKTLDSLSDEQLALEIAPGKNSGIYLLGHLTAVHDFLLPLLGFGDKLFPELFEVFIKNSDKSGLVKPTAQQLRKQWSEVNAILLSKISALSVDDLFAKHTSVSEEDFVKEPHRNRLNVIMSRISHLAYHSGQMALLKKS